MPIQFKTKLTILICLLTLTKCLANRKVFVHLNSNNVDALKRNNLSLNLEEKLDKLTNSNTELQKNINFVMAAVRKNHEELKTLSHIVHQSHHHLSAERKDHQNTKLNILEVKCANDRLPENCYQVNECQNHVYTISIPNYSEHPFPVSCDLKTEPSGWTVIQRRQDGSINFFRNWTEYVEGFGDLSGEFFIGLEKLHALTTQGGAQELYIILEDFEGVRRYAKYKTFRVDSKETEYKLTVGNYSGDAGDSFSYHSGFKFSTKDRDNDNNEKNCAEIKHGAWWYNSCFYSNLNGEYVMGKIFSETKRGVSWAHFRGHQYSLKYTQMMIRPRQI